jgi:hypothetical protein
VMSSILDVATLCFVKRLCQQEKCGSCRHIGCSVLEIELFLAA